MTVKYKAALMDDAISGEASTRLDSYKFRRSDFADGARFARSFYEQREVKWIELDEIHGKLCDHGQDCTDCDVLEQVALVARIKELRAALGLEG